MSVEFSWLAHYADYIFTAHTIRVGMRSLELLQCGSAVALASTCSFLTGTARAALESTKPINERGTWFSLRSLELLLNGIRSHTMLILLSATRIG